MKKMAKIDELKGIALQFQIVIGQHSIFGIILNIRRVYSSKNRDIKSLKIASASLVTALDEIH